MPAAKPYVLSIAGFDPSGGAGILADIKTFESAGCYGFGAVTALTVQNDISFEKVRWAEMAEIEQQVEILEKRFEIRWIKIGLVKDLDTLEAIIKVCGHHGAGARIVWDPILKTTSGFEIHSTIDQNRLEKILRKIFLLTPNTEEMKKLTGTGDAMKGAEMLSKNCNVFLKGGHSEHHRGRDCLFTAGKAFPFRPKRIAPHPKHGSGCVLSSAITAYLAKGFSLQRACLKGKDYVTKFLLSNDTTLGYHSM